MDQKRIKIILQNAIDTLNLTLDNEQSKSLGKLQAMTEIKVFLNTFYDNGEIRFCTPNMIVALRNFLSGYKNKEFAYFNNIICIPFVSKKSSKTMNTFIEENIAMLNDILNVDMIKKNVNVAKSMSINNVQSNSEFEKIKILNAEFSWLNALSAGNIQIDPTIKEALSKELSKTFRAWNDESKITNAKLLSSRIEQAIITLTCIINRLPNKQTNNLQDNFVQQINSLKSTNTFFSSLFNDSSSIKGETSTIRSDQSEKSINYDAVSQKSNNTIISNVSNLTQIEDPEISDTTSITKTLTAYTNQLERIKTDINDGKDFEDIIAQLDQVNTAIIDIVDPLLQIKGSNIMLTSPPEDDAPQKLHEQYQNLNDEKHIKENFAKLSPLAQLMHNVKQFELDPYTENHANKHS